MKFNKSKYIIAILMLLILIGGVWVYFLTDASTKLHQPQPKQKDSSLEKEKNQKPTTQINPEPSNNIALDQSKTVPYIVKCVRIDFTDEFFEQNNLDPNIFDSRVLNYVKTSSNESEQLLYILLTPNKKTANKINLLKDFTVKYPDNEFGQYSLLNNCTGFPEAKQCADIDNALITQLATNNGAIWWNLAVLRKNRMQTALAIKSLEKIDQAPHFDFYLGTYAAMYYEAIIAYGEGNRWAARMAALGVAATQGLLHYGLISNYCKENASADLKLEKICINVGRKMAFKGKTFLTTELGFGFLKSIYDFNDNQQALKQLEKEHLDSDYKKYQALRWQASAMLDYDETLFEDYFYNFTHKGEIIADRLLIEQAILRSRDPNYNPCPKQP